MSTYLEDVLGAIHNEREYQEEKWGNDFDDKHTVNDWVTFITMYASEAAKFNKTPEQQFELLKKATTIGVAALEAFYRNNGFVKRHYDKE